MGPVPKRYFLVGMPLHTYTVPGSVPQDGMGLEALKLTSVALTKNQNVVRSHAAAGTCLTKSWHLQSRGADGRLSHEWPHE